MCRANAAPAPVSVRPSPSAANENTHSTRIAPGQEHEQQSAVPAIVRIPSHHPRVRCARLPTIPGPGPAALQACRSSCPGLRALPAGPDSGRRPPHSPRGAGCHKSSIVTLLFMALTLFRSRPPPHPFPVAPNLAGGADAPPTAPVYLPRQSSHGLPAPPLRHRLEAAARGKSARRAVGRIMPILVWPCSGRRDPEGRACSSHVPRQHWTARCGLQTSRIRQGFEKSTPFS